MSLGNRAFFVLLGVLSAVTTGCGGGGGGGPVSMRTASPTATPVNSTPTPTPVSTTPTPTPVPTTTGTGFMTPVPISPTPSPTAIPTGATNPVTSRPLTTGDTFAYSGSSLETLVYRGSTPNPTSTIAYHLTQAVTDEGTTSFDAANPFDLRTLETDAGTNQTITVTTDAYFGSAACCSSQTGYYTYGYKSSDTNGQQITDTLAGVPSTNGLIDILPETQQQTWTNTGAGTLAESESDGFSANRTTSANGTYSETDLYPQGSQFTPPPSPLPATLSDNTDGSGTYSLPLFGETPNVTLSYSASSGGSITITASQPGSQPYTYTVDTWYALPLYSETDRELGALTIPAACNVSSTFGTSANGVEQTYTKVDTVLGTSEFYDEITYVVGGYAVCVSLNDVTYVFYDYSGQGNEPPLGASFSGGQSPLEVITLSSVVGLTSTSVSGATRRNAVQAGSERAAFARTTFRSAVERRNLERRHLAYQRLRASFSVRSHR